MIGGMDPTTPSPPAPASNAPPPSRLLAAWGLHRFPRRYSALAAGLVLAVSFFFAPETLPGPGLCWFERMTNLPCPGCGLTRAYCALSHARFADAMAFHPFAWVLYGLTLLVLLEPLWARVLPSTLDRVAGSALWKWSVPMLAAAMLLFGGVRLLVLLGVV